MKRYFLISFISALAIAATAQVPVATPPKKDPTLAERYYQLKATSETYQDYKVIKEFALDAFWKVAMDSMAAKKKAVSDAKAEMSKVSSETAQSKSALKQKEDSMQDVIFSSEHINFMGINFGKTAFVIIVCVIVAVLAAAVVGLFTQIKIMNSSASGNKNAVDELTREFEEYKKKAMEKQSKLSRELQTERNKLQELKGSR